MNLGIGMSEVMILAGMVGCLGVLIAGGVVAFIALSGERRNGPPWQGV